MTGPSSRLDPDAGEPIVGGSRSVRGPSRTVPGSIEEGEKESDERGDRRLKEWAEEEKEGVGEAIAIGEAGVCELVEGADTCSGRVGEVRVVRRSNNGNKEQNQVSSQLRLGSC